jgi:hypothetical protein
METLTELQFKELEKKINDLTHYIKELETINLDLMQKNIDLMRRIKAIKQFLLSYEAIHE